MSIEAINEQLLRAIGVGVALLDRDTLTFQFSNDTFEEWFGKPEDDSTLEDLFPELDTDLLSKELSQNSRYTASFPLTPTRTNFTN